MEHGKVPVKPLSGKRDWSIWKYRIKFVLNYFADALDVVEGRLEKPEEPDVTQTEAIKKKYKEVLKKFNIANNSAMMVLTNSMTEDTLQKVMRFNNARDVWLELHKIFEDSSDNQLYNICLEFFKVNWTNGDITDHLSKLKNLWNDLNNGLKMKKESKLPEMLLICKILDTLPSNYRSFKSSWLLLSDEKRTLDELTTQLCTHERELKKDPRLLEKDQEALIAYSNKSFSKREKYDTCHYCHKKGHWIKRCRKWIADGKPRKPNSTNTETGDRSKKTNASANMTLFAVHEEVFATETNSDNWFIDNGASRHVTNNSHYFINFEKFEVPHRITVANGKLLQAIGKGTVKILTVVNGISEIKFLENVWYVPEISKNLFSVLATQDKNQNSLFESTFKNCCLKINGKIVLQGSRNIGGGLFKADMKPLIPEKQVDINMAVNDDKVLQLYHERWGHQDKQHIKSIIEKELNIKVKPGCTKICEACVYGKAHRLKFGTRKKATKAGELVSTDICGPFNESSRKYRYFAIFKDDYTKFRYCFFLKHKSEIQDVLQDFIVHAKNLGHNIQEILSDNGGEFDNEAVRFILKKYGISQRLTAPYTPEQNNCERDNRTIVEMARTLKYSVEGVEFPNYLWAEFISTSVYILNRTGKSTVPNSSPYELWMNKKPRIKHMRIIGSVCYAHIPVQKRRKMDKKATKGYLLGYDGDERYRIYVKEKGTVILSRDVIFEEKPYIPENVITLPFQKSVLRKDMQNDEVTIDENKCDNTTDEEIQLEENKCDTTTDEETQLEENKCDITTNEDIQLKGKKVTDMQPKRRRSRRQISAPKWTKDYVMEDSDLNEEYSSEVNKTLSDEKSS